MDNQKVKKRERLSAFEPSTLIIGIILSVLSAIICMQLIGQVGVTPNTSLIGALFAMIIARIPIELTRKFRNLERQNYIQTIVSGAGFSAANCGFIAVALMYVMKKTEYLIPMGIGTMIGCGLSVFIVGRLFDSKIFPAAGAWPPGVATASALEAGDEGGKKGIELLQGLGFGIIGSFLKIPVAGIGIVFIADIFSMVGLGVGLILRGYSPQIFGGFEIGASNIPQGVMIGAGVVALIQSLVSIFKKKKGEAVQAPINHTVSDESTLKTLLMSVGLHAGGAIITALITGIISQMSMLQLVLWVVYAGIAATIAMIIVGMAAMNSGWFPAFAIVTIFMSLGIILGFPALPLAVLVGYLCSVGPCFADMGYDLKTGWIIRGKGADREHELYGRKQQVRIEALGTVIGIVVVLLFGTMLLKQDIMPPISRVFGTAVSAGADPALLRDLLLWAVPGAILQAIFGSKSVGVLFATGLLLNNPIYGIGILFAVVIRLIFGTKFMEIRSAGLIAGDGLYGFFSNVMKAFF